MSRFYKDLYGKPFKRDWVARVVFLKQILLFLGGHCSCSFWDIRLKIHSSLNINLLFQFLLENFPEANYFHVYRRLITWPTIANHLLVNDSFAWKSPPFRNFQFGLYTVPLPLAIFSCCQLLFSKEPNYIWRLFQTISELVLRSSELLKKFIMPCTDFQKWILVLFFYLV